MTDIYNCFVTLHVFMQNVSQGIAGNILVLYICFLCGSKYTCFDSTSFYEIIFLFYAWLSILVNELFKYSDNICVNWPETYLTMHVFACATGYSCE